MKSSTSNIGPLSPEYALLGLLAQAPAHGYQLHQRLVDELGQVWHVSQSQTYSILKRLEASGYIRGQVHRQEGLPDRRELHLTPSGQERFQAWLHAPSGSSVRAIRVEFITRIYFACQIDPALARSVIDDQEREILSGLSRMRRALAETPAEQPFNFLGLDLRVRQLESLIGWLDECRQLVDTMPAPSVTLQGAGPGKSI